MSRYPTKTLVAASPVTIPGVNERRVIIHKVSAPGALTIADATGSTLWGPGQANENFHGEPLRSQKAGDNVTVTSGTGGIVSVQFAYEGA